MSFNRSEYVSLGDVLLAPDWNLARTTSFMQENWVPTSYKITLAYLAIVYLGQKWMEKLPGLDNRPMNAFLALWNFTFSAFSGVAAYRLLPELFYTLKDYGFTGSMCHNGNYYTDPITGFWGWMFVMSKMPELGDTMFLIVRKKTGHFSPLVSPCAHLLIRNIDIRGDAGLVQVESCSESDCPHHHVFLLWDAGPKDQGPTSCGQVYHIHSNCAVRHQLLHLCISSEHKDHRVSP
jgi:hypothetical protein